ncbi:phosphodiester glycosidase family protein [Alloyangia pacifica]|uniref:phosphodiester glycosidase family protein n=1 Tax=Alloyangia pacifica TaxID=311180 RepID=UPI001CD365B6|nr:phosphodiester glycosidase family protein [Alloyangia pacifica]MCA0998725.1 phosphodiester glycosidase family protein [Alloyangia pacifica]
MRAALTALSLAAAALVPSLAAAVSCESKTFEDRDYTLCRVGADEDLRTFLRAPGGEVWGHFATLDAALREKGERLVFAMNAGMYHEDRAPVGHYVEDGTEEMRVISSPGPGNFGLLPNGILCIAEGTAEVYETRDFLAKKPQCRYATQSGPMLVIDGELHPRFLPDSTSRYIRNGVGTSADGKDLIFAISEEPVSFYEFGTLFRDGLDMPNALFFDGNVSRLFAPDFGRTDIGRPLGPIVGVVEPSS